jgi:hypothetical protein
MRPAPIGVLVVTLALIATLAGTVAYFRRYTMDRPPVGRYNLKDIAFMMAVVIALPPLYLRLPAWVVAAILVIVFVTILQFLLAPLLRGRLPLALAVFLVGVDILLATADGLGPGQWAFVVWNNLLIAAGVVGVCNLYVQNGMRARDVAFFAVALAGYDLVATAFLPLMLEFFTRLRAVPLAPILSWGEGSTVAAIGLGDVMMMALWTLAALKAFGPPAAVLAATVSVAASTAVFSLGSAGVITSFVPAMVILGPLMAGQYVAWSRWRGPERTVFAYRQGLAPSRTIAAAGWDGASALDSSVGWWRAHSHEATARWPGLYLALWEGEVIGTGSTPGEARLAARESRPEAMPTILIVPDRVEERGQVRGPRWLPASVWNGPQ